MALAAKPRSDAVALTTTAASNVLLVPVSGVDRFIKHIKVVNSAGATTFTLGMKASTTAPAAADAGIIAFQTPIAANSEANIFFTGDGLKQTNGAALNLNGSIAAGTGSCIIMSNEVAA